MSLARADHLRLVVEGKHAHQRAEHFLGDDADVVAAGIEDRRAHEIAAGERSLREPPPAGQELRALRLAARHIGEHLLKMRRGDQRPHLRLRIERVADLDLLGPRHELLQKRGAHALLHEHARAVRANLALCIEVAEDCGGDGVVEVGVGKDDQRRLAAELHGDVLQRAGGGGHDPFSRRHRAGERDFGDPRMCRKRRADLARAEHDGEEPGGRARFLDDLRKLDCRDRRQLARLEDHGVAGGKRRRALPARDLDRVVPRADPGADPERLAPRIGEGAFAEGNVLAVDRLREPGEELEAIGGRADIRLRRLLDRLAGVEHLKPRKLHLALAQQRRDAVQDAPALRGGKRDPRALRAFGRRHRLVDKPGVRRCDLTQNLAGRRVDVGEACAVFGRAVGAGDAGFQERKRGQDGLLEAAMGGAPAGRGREPCGYAVASL